MVDFAGWSMPVQYTSIVAEHTATRTAMSLFDVSHMGRLRLDGPGAAAFLESLLTRHVAEMAVGRIRYSLVTRDDGGILDDVLVYRLADAAGEPCWWMVVNAGNREKIVAWLRSRLGNSAGVELSDQTPATAMIAVQGPRAIDVLTPLMGCELAAMKYYTGCEAEIVSHQGLVSRTGYTGEDGAELIVPAAAAEHVWTTILAAGEPHGAMAAGLGCRDTLRLEAAMPLYGHELSERINPIQAGLGFAVDLEGRTFPGRDAIAGFQDDPRQLKRIGLELSGKRSPREHYAILDDGRPVGEVTSGTHSPTLQKPIAMGYVAPQHADVGRELSVDVRGRSEPARVVKLPFYRRGK